ncbi:hypothetical protein [Nioella aestuarii]|uniref:hypothetical protein n=1 Tax=Nioella aestuarii TaxID=1662864 RepID=UPI003D7F26BA
MEVLALDRDEIVLELVVHFLGIATHHNINAAPSSVSARGGSKRAETLLRSAVKDHSAKPGLNVANVHILQPATHEGTPLSLIETP